MNKDEALKMAYKAEETGNLQDLVDAVNALMEALEQPAQEPVAWTLWWADEPDYFDDEYISIYKEELEQKDVTGEPTMLPLYTHPHQWQGLTDEEIYDIIDDVFSKSTIEKNGVKTCSVHEGFRAIEQALKEKNT
jgi:hypothetical protein